MYKLIKYILGIALIITFSACPEEAPIIDSFIEIENNSDQDIVWLCLGNTVLSDTANLSEEIPWSNFYNNIISVGETYKDEFNSDNIKYYLNKGWLMYYLFSYDSLTTISWNRIRDENIILKKVYFETWIDMEACNYRITYP